MTSDERGQAFTLEGVIAAVVIASAVILGFQAVDLAPWTSGPGDDSIDSLRGQTEDLLAVAADDDTLTRAVTCLDGAEPERDAYDRSSLSATELGPMLNETFYQNGFQYNVYLRYWNTTGPTRTLEEVVVYPDSDNPQQVQNGVISVSRRVMLYDSMPARNGTFDCEPTVDTLENRSNASNIYVPDAQPDSEVYNVVEVVVEVW